MVERRMNELALRATAFLFSVAACLGFGSPATAQIPVTTRPTNTGEFVDPASVDPDGLLGADKAEDVSDDRKYVGSWDLKFKATTLSGKSVNFPEDYKGKLVLVVFWSTLDRAGKQELTFWRTAQARFQSGGLEVLGILTDQYRGSTPEQSKAALQYDFVQFPNIFEGGRALSLQFGIKRLPHAFLVNGDTGGVLFQTHQIRGENLMRRIQLLLVAPPKPAQLPGATPGPAAGKPERRRLAQPVDTGQPPAGSQPAKPDGLAQPKRP